MVSYADLVERERAAARAALSRRVERLGRACGRGAGAAVGAHPWLSLGAAAGLGVLAGRHLGRVPHAVVALGPIVRRVLAFL